MAAPSYTTDLATIDDATDTSSWSESSDAAWDDSVSGPDDDTENWISDQSGGGTPQGISCTTTKTGIATMIADYGSGITWTSGDVFLVWTKYDTAKAMDTYANGGLRGIAGTGLGDFKAWDIGGRDRAPYPAGGWINIAVDPEQTADDTVGSPGAAPRYFGVAVKIVSGIQKGYPFVADIIRYGRGEFIVEYGDLTNGYATFAGMAAVDGATGAQWGLFQELLTGYLAKGLVSFGTVSNAVDFRDDSGCTIALEDCPKCAAAFNKWEFNNASSNVELTGQTISSLGTQSPGTLVVNAAATLKFLRLTFEGWGDLTFDGANTASYFNDCIFKGCAEVSAGTTVLDFSGSSFLESTVNAAVTTGDAAFVWGSTTNPGTSGDLDDTTFVKGANAHHAIAFDNTTAATYTVSNCVFSGFNASHSQNDSTFYVAATSGTVTINCTGCSGNITYKSAGATVVLNINPVTTKVTVKDAETKAVVEGAAVTLYATGSGPYPYNLSVTSLTQSGGTATCITASAHNLSTGQKVWIKGASPNAYNRIKTITVTDTDEFTYPIDSGTSSPATGTITCTAVFIDEVTGATGIVSDSRVFSSDQDVEGYVSKGTKSPLYVRQNLAGTIDSTDGLSLTALLQSDE